MRPSSGHEKGAQSGTPTGPYTEGPDKNQPRFASQNILS